MERGPRKLADGVSLISIVPPYHSLDPAVGPPCNQSGMLGSETTQLNTAELCSVMEEENNLQADSVGQGDFMSAACIHWPPVSNVRPTWDTGGQHKVPLPHRICLEIKKKNPSLSAVWTSLMAPFKVDGLKDI
ncbi:hypothetical protein Bbelb_339770 [Branchiostoma belcheri]|nr:hypothetical protein Bbelb_339770 [Branchiostoma belcheri]